MNKFSKITGLFALATSLTACGPQNNQNKISKVEVQSPLLSKPVQSGCVIEVPYTDPELEAVGIKNIRKFYNFCENRVTLASLENNSMTTTGSWGGPFVLRKSFKDLDSLETVEKDKAYAVYQYRRQHP